MSARPSVMMTGSAANEGGEFVHDDTGRSLEAVTRTAFNAVFDCRAQSANPVVGGRTARHAFSMFDPGRVIGAIVVAPWRERMHQESVPTPGQDRATAELLWLTLWEGPERRVLVVTDLDMAQGLITRFHGCYVPAHVDVLHFDSVAHSFYLAGRVGAD